MMAIESGLQLTIDISQVDPDLEPEELESLTSSVKDEITDIVEDAQLVRESDIPKDGKPALAGFILGVLKAEVSIKNITTLVQVLRDRFGNKPIQITSEKNGKKFSVNVGNAEDLDKAVEALRKLAEM